jgi:hypothetical protein
VRLLGARGTSETGGDIPVPVRIQAWTMRRRPLPFYLMALASAVMALVLLIVSRATGRSRTLAEKEDDE